MSMFKSARVAMALVISALGGGFNAKAFAQEAAPAADAAEKEPTCADLDRIRQITFGCGEAAISHDFWQPQPNDGIDYSNPFSRSALFGPESPAVTISAPSEAIPVYGPEAAPDPNEIVVIGQRRPPRAVDYGQAYYDQLEERFRPDDWYSRMTEGLSSSSARTLSAFSYGVIERSLLQDVISVQVNQTFEDLFLGSITPSSASPGDLQRARDEEFYSTFGAANNAERFATPRWVRNLPIETQRQLGLR